MKKRSPHDKALAEVVKPYGFFKCRQAFIRLCGNGVIQSVTYRYEPHSLVGDGYMLYFNVGSIYERLLFGYSNDLVEMTDDISASEYYALKHDAVRRESWNWDEAKQLEVFTSGVLPILLPITSQEEVFQLHKEIMLLKFSEYLYHRPIDLYLMLYLGMYDEAYKTVKATIANRRETGARNYAFFRTMDSEEEVQKIIKRDEQRLKPYIAIQDALESEDYAEIDRIIQAQRDYNLEVLESLLPQGAKKQLPAFIDAIPAR